MPYINFLIFHLGIFPHLLRSFPMSCNDPLVLQINYKLNSKLRHKNPFPFQIMHLDGDCIKASK